MRFPFTVRLSAALLCLLFAPAVARGQSGDRSMLVIFSRPPAGAAKDKAVDLSYYVQQGLATSPRWNPVPFQASLPEVKAALDAKTLDPVDVVVPLSDKSMAKVARVLGATNFLRVSVTYGEQGIVGEAAMQTLTSQAAWSTVWLETFAGVAKNHKRVGLADAIHGAVGSLLERLRSTANAPDGKAPAPTASAPASGTDSGTVVPVVTPKGDAKPEVKPGADGTKSPTPAQTAPGAKKAPTLSRYDLLIDAARKNNDVTGLIVELRHAVNERPRDAILRRDLVRAYLDRGMMDEAESEGARGCGLCADDAPLRRTMGDVYIALGKQEEALNQYKEAVRLDAKDPSSLVALGTVYLSLARPDDAEKCFKDAIGIDKACAPAHRKLAVLYAERAKYADSAAEMTLLKAATAPTDAAVYDADCATVLDLAASVLGDTLSKLQNASKTFRDGTKTREQTYQIVNECKQKADDLAAFLDALPGSGLSRAQALYSQAGALVGQACESAKSYLETNNSTDKDQFELVSNDARSQMLQASKQLKATLSSRRS